MSDFFSRFFHATRASKSLLSRDYIGMVKFTGDFGVSMRIELAPALPSSRDSFHLFLAPFVTAPCIPRAAVSHHKMASYGVNIVNRFDLLSDEPAPAAKVAAPVEGAPPTPSMLRFQF